VKPLLVTAAALAALLFAPPAFAHGATVKISADGIAPPELVITRGETVHFQNGDSRPATVVGDDDAFHSPEMPPGEGWHLRFPFPGRFPFGVEGRPKLRGTIVVEDAGK
jgi:plastocyanin